MQLLKVSFQPNESIMEIIGLSELINSHFCVTAAFIQEKGINRMRSFILFVPWRLPCNLQPTLGVEKPGKQKGARKGNYRCYQPDNEKAVNLSFSEDVFSSKFCDANTENSPNI